MDFIFSFFAILFIALILGSALFFGFILLMWIIAGAVAIALFVYLREVIRRRIFLHNANQPPRDNSPGIIDGKYTDITDNNK